MNADKINIIKSYYFQITDIWKRFCEEHTTLLDITFEEYACLLSSEIIELEGILERKNDIILKIHSLETLRETVIKNINLELNAQGFKEIENVSSLLLIMQEYEVEQQQKHLYSFNALLIDIIEKLKDQNKKNQMFLNKAINSLRNIKEEAFGLKSYSTYNKSGITKNNVIP